MPTVYIAFGSNIGDRDKNIQQAIGFLKAYPKIKVQKISSIIETEPVGGPKQGKFLNGALKIKTELSARDLLNALHDIENKLGRQCGERNGPRTIDIDIIFYGNETINEPDLVIPHPRWRQRKFVLEPLREVGAIHELPLH